MNEKLSLAVAAGVLAIMVITGTITLSQALEFCRSILEIARYLSASLAVS